MSEMSDKFVFPRWANYLLPALVLGVLGAGVYVPSVVYLGLNPNTLNTRYRPIQPVPYSHAIHVGQLGMDCTYCHTTVKEAAFAAIPPTQTCVNCHGDGGPTSMGIKKGSLKLQPVYESYATGEPIEWVKVHDLADYSYFNHAAHTTKGIGCVTCHGRVDLMGEEGVYQAKNLSMSWCIECHREPEKYLRPADQVTNMVWQPADDARVQGAIAAGTVPADDADAQQRYLGTLLKEQYRVHNVAYMQACSTCHR